MPRLSIVEVAPFDAISSSGVRASEGSNACSAGRMSVTANPSTAANANTSGFGVREERDGRRAERNGADEHQREEEALPGEAVAQRRRERRNDRRGQQADEPRDADRGRAADVVGEDAERDEVRPLRRDRRPPRQLHASDVRVPKSRTERSEQLAGTPHAAN